MKKIISICILGFVICTAFNKPQLLHSALTGRSLFTDYRDAYTGTYLCKSYIHHLSLENKQYVNDKGTVSIVISKDALDSVLQINLSQQILKAKLINNVLQPYPQGGHYGGRFYAADSLSFGYTPSMAVSLRYIGKKI